jgi:phage shock protein C
MADQRQHSDDGSKDRSPDFQSAVDKLEDAVQDIVQSAKGELTDRATTFIDETTARLRAELGPGSYGADTHHGQEAYEEETDTRSHRSSRRRHRPRPTRRAYRDYTGYSDYSLSSYRGRYSSWKPRTQQLYRDPTNQKIVGVCSGLANYFGLEPWVVRCGAITGLLFLPGIVFPAYWVMYFVMSNPPLEGDAVKESKSGSRRGRRKQSRQAKKANTAEQPISPRRSLRSVQAGLTQTELRLRRLETHVTSGQYELQKELNKLDDGGKHAPA